MEKYAVKVREVFTIVSRNGGKENGSSWERGLRCRVATLNEVGKVVFFCLPKACTRVRLATEIFARHIVFQVATSYVHVLQHRCWYQGNLSFTLSWFSLYSSRLSFYYQCLEEYSGTWARTWTFLGTESVLLVKSLCTVSEKGVHTCSIGCDREIKVFGIHHAGTISVSKFEGD